MLQLKLFFTFLIVIFIKNIDTCGECNSTYQPPCNMKFPYGDENQFNVDVSENDTNMILCSDGPKLAPKQGRCPFPPEDPEDMRLTNPYVRCTEFPAFIPPVNLAFGDPVPPPSVQCKTCDIKLMKEDSAVVLKCTGCFDLPDTDHPANCTEKDILYKVYFLGIANYTSVDVQGRENF